MQKIFVNEKVEIFREEQAEPFLKETNDLVYFNEEELGIHKVSKERWETAQTFEKLIWMEKSPFATDDRNLDHFKYFAEFEQIKDELKKKKTIIELGCGPFTNIRLLTEFFESPCITLLDPLINSYVNHNNCPYSSGMLNQNKVTLINSSIEEFGASEKYDVILMINVIEHCFDAEAIFNKIINLLNDDGIFIFSDVYFKDVKTLAANIYDAGHPLRLSELKMDQFLKYFDPIFDQRHHGLYEQNWRNDIYFIGKLKAGTTI